MKQDFQETFDKIKYFGYDTETTGLNFIKDTPFLLIFGFHKHVYYWNPQELKGATYTMFAMVKKANKMLFAHNAKYDFHMLYNIGTPIPDDIEVSDSAILYRLINNCDDEHASMKLENLGEKFVDPDAKFASYLIKDILENIKKERKKIVCNNYKMITGSKAAELEWKKYKKRIRFITKYHEAFDDYKEPTYYDAYLEDPEMFISYGIDDVVILLEALEKLGKIYAKRYFDAKTNSIDTRIWKQENKLIRAIADMERNGFKVDVDYLIESHYRIEKFKEELYAKLHKLTGEDWNVGQHDKIKDFFKNKYNITLEKSDKKHIVALQSHENKEVQLIAKLIIKLRTVDKWLSTYIDGVLNKIMEVNGEWKLFTSINNNGTVSGRVSCDLQQMPKLGIDETDKDANGDDILLLDESLTDDEEHELFHPRKFIIPSDGYTLYFGDFSQMELRIQAFYTILVGHTDYNLCRAYMPYDCYTLNPTTWEKIEFDYTNKEHIKHAYDWKWFNNKDNTEWEPTDLHTKTTLTAFPEWADKTDTKEFKKKWRYLGKSTNFARHTQLCMI